MSDKQWKVAKDVIPHAGRVLLYGPPGTGKTSIGFEGEKGADALYVPCHDEMSVAELLGHFVPIGDRFIWLNGPGLQAAIDGKRLILDEIDQSSGSVLSVLRALLNDPSVARFTIPDPSLAGLSDEALTAAILSGKGIKTIKPAEGFQAIASMNGEPEDLDGPLLDRFEAVICIETPNPDAIAALPEDLRAAAKQTASQKDEDRRIGLRRWKAFAQLREKVGEDTAGYAVFGARYGDVTDALKLSRAAAPVAVAPVTMDTPGPDSPSINAAADRLAAAVASDKPLPTAYFQKTGQRGRPPRVACSRHGYITGSKAVEAPTGELHCKRCDEVVAESGKWTARVLDPISGKWSNR